MSSLNTEQSLFSNISKCILCKLNNVSSNSYSIHTVAHRGAFKNLKYHEMLCFDTALMIILIMLRISTIYSQA